MEFETWQKRYLTALYVNEIKFYNMDYQSFKKPGYVRIFPPNSKFTQEYVILNGIKIYGSFADYLPSYTSIADYIIFYLKNVKHKVFFIVDKSKNGWEKLYNMDTISEFRII